MIGHMSEHLCLPVSKIINWPLDLFIGVPIFFILSGFLIWNSLENTLDFKQFFSKRILRLYPELWVCLIVEILSIVLFYEKPVPVSDYVLFTFTQGTVLQFWTPDSLRGYGCDTPNGALWTINVIVQFYVFIYWLRNWLNKQGVKTWIFLLLLTLVVGGICPILPRLMPVLVGKLFMQTLLPYSWLFFAGVFIQRYKERMLGHLIKFWWVYFTLYVINVSVGMDIYVMKYPMIRCLLLTLFMIGFAYRYPMIHVGKDVSYGVYIYHMIFVNIAIALGYTRSWMAFGIVIVVTWAVAYFSTILVGEYSRRIKERILSAGR